MGHIRTLGKLTIRETLDNDSAPEKETILDMEVEFKPEDIIHEDQAMEQLFLLHRFALSPCLISPGVRAKNRYMKKA